MPSDALSKFRDVILGDWPQAADEDAKARLLAISSVAHADIMRHQGNPPFTAYANTPGNTNLDSVRLPGPIVYHYSGLRQLVEFALAELIALSPVASGHYARSHTVYRDGKPLNPASDDIDEGDHVMIANPLPFSRRLEIGKTESGRAFLVSVPNRIYERVAENLIARYGRAYKIEFDFVTLPTTHSVHGEGTTPAIMIANNIDLGDIR